MEHKDDYCEKHEWWHDDMRVCMDDPECCARFGCGD